MKEKVLATCFLLLYTLAGLAQTTKTYEIKIDRNEFEFGEFDGYDYIGPIDFLSYHSKGISNTPAILYKEVEIILPEQEHLKNISFTVGDCVQMTNIKLVPDSAPVPMDEDNTHNNMGDIPYEIKDYPFEFEYNEPPTNGRRYVIVSFNVFAYNAVTETVSWPESFRITVETEPLEEWEYVSSSIWDGFDLYHNKCINPEDYWDGNKIPSIIGAVWSYANSSTTTEGEGKYDFFRYTVLDEPKEMNGHVYYPMVKYTACEYSPDKELLRVYLREEGCCIYKYSEQEEEESLLYNFAIQPYDKHLKEQHHYFKNIDGKKLIITDNYLCHTAEDNFPFRKMIIGENTQGNNMTWIDGIGNIQDFLVEYNTQLDGSFVLNYYRSGDGKVVYKNAFPDLMEYKADDCTVVQNPNAIKKIIKAKNQAIIQTTSSFLLCTAPNAVKLEVYTMDAIKVGEARFVDGKAAVKVGEVPAMYLYIVTYPDGRRESGKARISEE